MDFSGVQYAWKLQRFLETWKHLVHLCIWMKRKLYFSFVSRLPVQCWWVVQLRWGVLHPLSDPGMFSPTHSLILGICSVTHSTERKKSSVSTESDSSVTASFKHYINGEYRPRVKVYCWMKYSNVLHTCTPEKNINSDKVLNVEFSSWKMRTKSKVLC